MLCGGARLAGSAGYFYPPTIVAGIKEGVRLWDEEQFGPVRFAPHTADTYHVPYFAPEPGCEANETAPRQPQRMSHIVAGPAADGVRNR